MRSRGSSTVFVVCCWKQNRSDQSYSHRSGLRTLPLLSLRAGILKHSLKSRWPHRSTQSAWRKPARQRAGSTARQGKAKAHRRGTKQASKQARKQASKEASKRPARPLLRPQPPHHAARAAAATPLALIDARSRSPGPPRPPSFKPPPALSRETLWPVLFPSEGAGSARRYGEEAQSVCPAGACRQKAARGGGSAAGTWGGTWGGWVQGARLLGSGGCALGEGVSQPARSSAAPRAGQGRSARPGLEVRCYSA